MPAWRTDQGLHFLLTELSTWQLIINQEIDRCAAASAHERPRRMHDHAFVQRQVPPLTKYQLTNVLAQAKLASHDAYTLILLRQF